LDGPRVPTGSDDNTAWLWDTVTSKVVATLPGHSAPVRAVAFSPDGTRVLTGSWDKTGRLWDATTGEAVATLAGHASPVEVVAFSRDGKRVLTGSWGHTARLWPVFKSAQNLIDTLRASGPRCLTPTQREAFHLGTPPPRWCYERNLWPFADHGQPYTEGGTPHGSRHRPRMKSCSRLGIGSARGSAAHRPTRISPDPPSWRQDRDVCFASSSR
jgi:hypothetical protein